MFINLLYSLYITAHLCFSFIITAIEGLHIYPLRHFLSDRIPYHGSVVIQGIDARREGRPVQSRLGQIMDGDIESAKKWQINV